MSRGSKSSRKGLWLTTRDIVAIALIAAMGGVMSAYVGYLGNMMNSLAGVPYGAGQFLAGLHVFWLVLAAGLTRRFGAASAAGLLKGFIEFLSGSTHGIPIIFASLAQGIVIDIVLLPFPARWRKLGSLVGAGLSSASFILFFQILYLEGTPTAFLIAMYALAFCSGIVLGGWFGEGMLDSVRSWGVARWHEEDDETAAVSDARGSQARPSHHGGRPRPGGTGAGRGSVTFTTAVVVLLALALIAGAGYYFAFVYRLPANLLGKEPSCDITGRVTNEFTYEAGDFKSQEVTVREELSGDTQHVPAKNYTGVPLRALLEHASPLNGSSSVTVRGADGYAISFRLDDVMASSRMVLIEEGGTLRLVAGGYPGSHWVRAVVEIEVS